MWHLCSISEGWKWWGEVASLSTTSWTVANNYESLCILEITSWFKYIPTPFWFLDVQSELFLFILLFRDLSAVQSWSAPAALAQLSHMDSPADAAGRSG